MFNSQLFLSSLSLAGKEISLEVLLEAKEKRALLQQQCLQKYGQSLVSLTLLAPGAIKKNALLDYIFSQALEQLDKLWLKLNIKPTVSFIRPLDTGHEAIFVINIEAEKLKHHTIELEENIPLARLWDIDVFTSEGKLLTRTDLNYQSRSCLICHHQAKHCARIRKHSQLELYQTMQQRVAEYIFANYVTDLVNQALLTEAKLTPKPGLVDQADQGAHKDMTLTTFLISSEALYPFWSAFVYKGIQTAKLPIKNILSYIRPIGIKAEQAMFAATKGINTHKGSIFAFGLVCTGLGRLFSKQKEFNWQDLSLTISLICQGITQELQHADITTAGIKIYHKYGIKGARGEAEQGFPLVSFGLSELLKQEKIYDEQHRLLLALLNLLANNQDTNVIHRSGMEGLTWFRHKAKQLIEQKEIVMELDKLHQALNDFNQQCIAKNISPGGSADLLALSWFIYRFFYFNT